MLLKHYLKTINKIIILLIVYIMDNEKTKLSYEDKYYKYIYKLEKLNMRMK